METIHQKYIKAVVTGAIIFFYIWLLANTNITIACSAYGTSDEAILSIGLISILFVLILIALLTLIGYYVFSEIMGWEIEDCLDTNPALKLAHIVISR